MNEHITKRFRNKKTQMGEEERWEEKTWDEKVIEICMKIFWPTLAVWCIAALAKIILVFS